MLLAECSDRATSMHREEGVAGLYLGCQNGNHKLVSLLIGLGILEDVVKKCGESALVKV